MSLIDKLLQLDSDKVQEKPVKEVEIQRLSKLLKTKAIFKCTALDGETHSDIQRTGIDLTKKGAVKEFKMFEMKLHTILAGVVEPSLKDKALLDHYKAVTPKELIKKLFLPGEIDDLYLAINELSGYEKDDEEDEIKN